MPSDLNRLLAGDPLAVARALTSIESRDAASAELLAELYPRAGQAHVVGFTGPPGAGKSSLLRALATHLAERRRIAILAVDPSSPRTGGAVLADRIRMTGLESQPSVFVRSLATRGNPGSLSSVTWDAVTVLDALGFDPVLVETVGAGQNEIEVRGLAHTTVLVDAPGLGDSVQALKAGMLEVCDLVVVNKGDRPGADLAASQIAQTLQLGSPPAEGDWQVAVLTASAQSGQGVPELWERLEAHFAYLQSSGAWRRLETERAAHQVNRLVRQGWLAALDRFLPQSEREAILELVRSRRLDPQGAAARLLAKLPDPPQDRE